MSSVHLDVCIIFGTNVSIACRFGVDESIVRLKAAIEAGADVAFFEAARTKEDVVKVVEALKPTPVLLNILQGGVTPDFTVPEMEAMGVKIGVSLWLIEPLTSSWYQADGLYLAF